MQNDFVLDTGGLSLADLNDETDELAAAVEEREEYRPAAAPADDADNGCLYFDLETVPDYDRLELFKLEPIPPVPDESSYESCPPVAEVVGGTVDQVKLALRAIVAPENYLNELTVAEMKGKNRAGVHEAIKAARDVRGEAIAAHADRRKLLSTTPEYCKIAALGWAVGNGPVRSFVTDMPVVDQESMSEYEIVAAFWNLASRYAPLIVFNGAGFDLPVIFARSAILGIPSSRMFDLKPWGKDVRDLYLLRFGGKGNTDRSKPGKLKQLARLYGVPVPAGDVDGSQVEELMKSDPAKVGEYVRSDVEVLRGFHRKLCGYFWT